MVKGMTNVEKVGVSISRKSVNTAILTYYNNVHPVWYNYNQVTFAFILSNTIKF